MPYRILLPLDGSSRSERAIPTVNQLASALRAEVEVLQVIDADEIFRTSSTGPTPVTLEVRTRLAREYLQDIGQRFHDVTPATVVLYGSPGATVVQRARGHDIDLIAMTSHGHTGLVGTLLGSVARDVVRMSPVPVLVLRERVALPLAVRDLRVLIPLDGSELAEAILRPVERLARALDWQLHICWVADPADEVLSEQTTGATHERVRRAYPEIAHRLTSVADRIRESGLRADLHLGCGDCGPNIVELAERLGVDIIAMSTHGRKGLGRLVLGSITEYVIGHAGTPVLAARPADTANIDDHASPSAMKEGRIEDDED
jgi:nucleotide-binding universal stress UspA family protein